MSPAENIEKLIKNVKIDTNAGTDEAVLKDVLKALENQKKKKSAKPAPNIWRIIMKTKTAKLTTIAVIVIAVMIGINQFGGSIGGAGVAWADVIEILENDIKSTNTIHVLLTIYTGMPKPKEDEKVKSVGERTIKGEFWLRREPFAGKSILEGEQTNYFTEHKWICLDHHGKKWLELSIPKEKAGKKMYGMFDALVTGDFTTHTIIPEFNISQGQIVGNEIIAGEQATIYEFVGTPSDKKKDEGHPPIHFKCWIKDSDNKTVRMHMNYGDPNKTNISCDLIEYDVIIPPGTLEVKIPEGYTKSEEYTKFLSQKEQIRANVPEDIIDLKQTYDGARDAFLDYRMVILDNDGNIVRRVAKAGERWRLDNYVWRSGNKQPVDISKHVDFDSLWQRAELLSSYIEITLMSYKKGRVQLIWPREDLGNSARSRYQKHVKFSDTMNTVENVAWPEIPLIGPNSNVELLPPSQEFPGCVGIRYSQETKTKRPKMALLVIWWIDPSKNYMCIKHERHQRKAAVWASNLDWEPNEPIADFDPHNRGNSLIHYHSTITEITESTLSPEGFWYPTERQIQYHSINESGERIFPPGNQKVEKIYIDTQGAIDSNLFEWPEELPLPSK